MCYSPWSFACVARQTLSGGYCDPGVVAFAGIVQALLSARLRWNAAKTATLADVAVQALLLQPTHLVSASTVRHRIRRRDPRLNSALQQQPSEPVREDFSADSGYQLPSSYCHLVQHKFEGCDILNDAGLAAALPSSFPNSLRQSDTSSARCQVWRRQAGTSGNSLPFGW